MIDVLRVRQTALGKVGAESRWRPSDLGQAVVGRSRRPDTTRSAIRGAAIAGTSTPLWYVPTSPHLLGAELRHLVQHRRTSTARSPPATSARLQVLTTRCCETVDEAKRLELGQKILELHDKNVWIIGSVQPPFQPIVVATTWSTSAPVRRSQLPHRRRGATTEMSQLYFKNPRIMSRGRWAGSCCVAWSTWCMTLFLISLCLVPDHPAAAGRLPDHASWPSCSARGRPSIRPIWPAAAALRPRSAGLGAVLELDHQHRPARRFRTVLRSTAGRCRSWSPSGCR